MVIIKGTQHGHWHEKTKTSSLVDLGSSFPSSSAAKACMFLLTRKVDNKTNGSDNMNKKASSPAEVVPYHVVWYLVVLSFAS